MNLHASISQLQQLPILSQPPSPSQSLLFYSYFISKAKFTKKIAQHQSLLYKSDK